MYGMTYPTLNILATLDSFSSKIEAYPEVFPATIKNGSVKKMAVMII